MRKFTVIFLLLLSFGFSFADIEWKTRLNTKADKRANRKQMIMHAFAKNGDVKQTFEDVKKNNSLYYNKSIEWLYKINKNTMYIINHKKKSYTPMNIDHFLQMSQVAGDIIKIKIKDFKVSHQNLPSENILGYKCSHIKIISDYVMTIKITFIKKTMRVHEEKEIWATNKIKGLDNIASAFADKNYKTGFKDLDKMIAKQVGLYKKLGFPLKTITYNLQKNKKGKRVLSEMTTTEEVFDIKNHSLKLSLFELPKGYTENETPTTAGKSKKKKFKLKNLF
jgi:hypothetical protein